MQSALGKILKDGRTSHIYKQLLASQQYDCSPHEFIGKTWKAYKLRNHNRSTNGFIFEFLIGEVLLAEQIRPLYYQARIQHVHNAIFDWLCYHEIAPVVLSAKVSLRERWKMAAFEADALRRVYERAETYLVTLNKKEADARKPKNNDELMPGVTEVVVADQPEFTELVRGLRGRAFSEAVPVNPVQKGELIR